MSFAIGSELGSEKSSASCLAEKGTCVFEAMVWGWVLYEQEVGWKFDEIGRDSATGREPGVEWLHCFLVGQMG